VKRKRAQLVRRQSRSAGLPPGTLVHVGEKKLEQPRIVLIDYDEQNFQERQVSDIKECIPFKGTPTVSWVNIDGLHDVGLIESLGREFEVHLLILEDVLNTGQRPKFEDFEKHIFVVLKMISYDNQAQGVISEQVSLVLGDNFVLSFQESIGDVFEQIRARIRNARGRIRKFGPDYLMYALLDAVVDGYFAVLERLGEKIEKMEEELVTGPTEQTLRQIHDLKREMIFLRKSVWPLRELISALQRCESDLI